MENVASAGTYEALSTVAAAASTTRVTPSIWDAVTYLFRAGRINEGALWREALAHDLREPIFAFPAAN